VAAKPPARTVHPDIAPHPGTLADSVARRPDVVSAGPTTLD